MISVCEKHDVVIRWYLFSCNVVVLLFFSNRFDTNNMRTTTTPHTPRDLNATATHVTLRVHYLDLTIFNKGAYLTFKLIFHKALNLF